MVAPPLPNNLFLDTYTIRLGRSKVRRVLHDVVDCRGVKTNFMPNTRRLCRRELQDHHPDLYRSSNSLVLVLCCAMLCYALLQFHSHVVAYSRAIYNPAKVCISSRFSRSSSPFSFLIIILSPSSSLVNTTSSVSPFHRLPINSHHFNPYQYQDQAFDLHQAPKSPQASSFLPTSINISTHSSHYTISITHLLRSSTPRP